MSGVSKESNSFKLRASSVLPASASFCILSSLDASERENCVGSQKKAFLSELSQVFHFKLLKSHFKSTLSTALGPVRHGIPFTVVVSVTLAGLLSFPSSAWFWSGVNPGVGVTAFRSAFLSISPLPAVKTVTANTSIMAARMIRVKAIWLRPLSCI